MPSYVSASGIAAGGAPRGSDKRGGGGGGAASGDVASRVPDSAPAEHVVELTLRLNMDFQTAGQEQSTKRQNFIKDLKQDLADASGIGTSDCNILKVSPGSVVVDVDAPEKAAQEIQRQSLDPNSRLRSGKVTRFTDKITMSSATRPPQPQQQSQKNLQNSSPVHMSLPRAVQLLVLALKKSIS